MTNILIGFYSTDKVASQWLRHASQFAACAYLLKSLSTNSRNQLFTKEPNQGLQDLKTA